MMRTMAAVAALWATLAAGEARAHCALVVDVYAHALSLGREAEFVDLLEAYSECVVEIAESSAVGDAALSLLRARDQVGDRVRLSAYDGRVQAHPLVVRASFFIARGLQSEARLTYVSSVVRSPDQQRRLLRHPVLRRQAAQRSKHVLGGLAADVAFIRRKRSMAALGAKARRILRAELGEQASLLRVVVEPYCLHVEIDGRHPGGKRIIERRKQELADAGILKRVRPGVPRLADYRSERSWRERLAQAGDR